MSDIPTKTETRGRKKINQDGTDRRGRYIKCPCCRETFFYDHRNPDTKPSPRKGGSRGARKVKVKESEQEMVDRLMSEPFERDIKIVLCDEKTENFI